MPAVLPELLRHAPRAAASRILRVRATQTGRLVPSLQDLVRVRFFWLSPELEVTGASCNLRECGARLGKFAMQVAERASCKISILMVLYSGYGYGFGPACNFSIIAA